MNKAEIMTNVTRGFYKACFKVKKHSPEILLATGIVGGVASAVMACKATTKIDTILETTKETIDGIHEGVKNGEIKGVTYTEEDGKKDLTLVYVQTGVKFAKLYGPALLVGAASIGCVLASHNIINKRNIALAAAYATVDNSFKEYRGRVIERFGKELDKELKYNIKAQEIEDRVVDEDGHETVTKTTIQVAEPSDYAKVFDEWCT